MSQLRGAIANQVCTLLRISGSPPCSAASLQPTSSQLLFPKGPKSSGAPAVTDMRMTNASTDEPVISSESSEGEKTQELLVDWPLSLEESSQLLAWLGVCLVGRMGCTLLGGTLPIIFSIMPQSSNTLNVATNAIATELTRAQRRCRPPKCGNGSDRHRKT